MSDKRQKALITSLLVVLIVLTVQLWIFNWFKEESLASGPVPAPSFSPTAARAPAVSESSDQHWEHASQAVLTPALNPHFSNTPSLNFQLQSVSLESGQWHGKITNALHQVFDIAVGVDISGLGRVVDINNQHVVFQSDHLKTDIGFSHFKQELTGAVASVSSESEG